MTQGAHQVASQDREDLQDPYEDRGVPSYQVGDHQVLQEDPIVGLLCSGVFSSSLVAR